MLEFSGQAEGWAPLPSDIQISDTRRGDSRIRTGANPNKRRRVDTANFTRRKRATTACQFCRLRKTKCDNVHPTCGFCVQNEARCVYGETTNPPTHVEDSPKQQQTADEVVGRLEEIRELLLNMQGRSTAVGGSEASAEPYPTTTTNETLAIPNRSPWARFSPSLSPSSPTRVESSVPHHERYRLPFAAFRAEALLKWPALAPVVLDEVLRIDSFPLSVDDEIPSSQAKTGAKGVGIREEDFVPLCAKFLEQVHPRNPVLDGAELMRQAHAATEYGLQYNSDSCIVLLACALAAFTKPWIRPNSYPNFPDDSQLQAQEDENIDTAEEYYLAARKRIGLLGSSIKDIQCLFFAHIFEKSMLQPLKAWFHLQQASNRLETLLLKRGERPKAPFQETNNPKDYHLEQRLYWSCFRSESELVFELGLRPGGLEKFSYPEAFPRLPDEFATYRNQPDDMSPGAIHRQQQNDEMSWSYYLSEISVRRVMDETLNLWYRKGESYWTTNPTHLIEQYYECERLISSWHHHLPSAVQFKEDEVPDAQFANALQSRALIWHESILRPIVYHALHRDSDKSVPREIYELGSKAVNICARIVHRTSFHTRQGGSWLILRTRFSAACVILAAVLHPDRLESPREWESLIQSTIESLTYWGGNARDVAKMAGVLDNMYQGVRDIVASRPTQRR